MDASGDTAPDKDRKAPGAGDEEPKRLSPAALAAIARYRRLVGNVADSAADDEAPTGDRGDLDRHLAERPPHWGPPRNEGPAPQGS